VDIQFLLFFNLFLNKQTIHRSAVGKSRSSTVLFILSCFFLRWQEEKGEEARPFPLQVVGVERT